MTTPSTNMTFRFHSLSPTKSLFHASSIAYSRSLTPVSRMWRILYMRPLSVSRDSKKKDYYAILGITPKATKAQVKEAYLTLTLRWHPDKNKGNEEEAHSNFTGVTEAYSVLGNYETRRKYDRGMFREHGHHGAQPSKGDMRRAEAAARDFDQFYRSHYEGVKKHKERMAKEKKFKEERQEFGDAGTQQKFIFTTVFTLLAGFLYYVRKLR